jgi:hypothetical protein
MIQAVFYALSGFLMKISDDSHDKKKNIFLGISAAILCGASIGYLAVYSGDAACIFLAILIGTVAAWKVDCLNHVVSLLIFLLIIVIFGFPPIGIVTLLICAAAAFMDEIGNDGRWVADKKHFNTFFEYRFALKIVILVFAVLGLIQNMIPGLMIPGIQFFSLETFVYFILFEISYELAGLKFDAIYDGLYSFFRVLRVVD